jgi:hypothetical protein
MGELVAYGGVAKANERTAHASEEGNGRPFFVLVTEKFREGRTKGCGLKVGGLPSDGMSFARKRR